jgi:hypothetical protein
MHRREWGDPRMRFGRMLFALLLLAPLPLAAAPPPPERALVIRAGDLMAQPFIDAAKVAPVSAGDPVVIVARRGGWVSVQANGKTGWLRALNLRLEPGAGGGVGRASNALSRSAALLRTGSSGKTVTTGVKGLGEEDIRNATIDPAQLAELTSLAVTPSAARDTAAGKKLAESKVDYLKPGERK